MQHFLPNLRGETPGLAQEAWIVRKPRSGCEEIPQDPAGEEQVGWLVHPPVLVDCGTVDKVACLSRIEYVISTRDACLYT